ncbi:MAG: GIY-YIG nuclease family protein [Nanoarchaeota archaeon]
MTQLEIQQYLKNKYKLNADKIRFPFVEVDFESTFSGIYACMCIADTNNKFYIGSSNDALGRKKDHLSDLKNGEHVNRYLQRAYNKYGEKNFIWFCIEKDIPEKYLLRLEQFYLDAFRAYECKIGYNIARIAGRPTPTSKNFSFFRKGQRVDVFNLSDFCRKNNFCITIMLTLYNGVRNKPYQSYVSNKSEKIKKKQLSYREKFHLLIDDKYIISKVKSFKPICRKMGVCHELLKYNSKNGKFCKGLFLIKDAHTLSEQEIREKLKYVRNRIDENNCLDKYHILINQNCEILKVKNLTEFCEKNSIHPNTLDFNANNGIFYKGYFLIKNAHLLKQVEINNTVDNVKAKLNNSDNFNSINNSGQRYHYLIGKNREMLKIDNLDLFCRGRNIDPVTLDYNSNKNRFHKEFFLIKNCNKFDEANLQAIIQGKLDILFPQRHLEDKLKEVTNEETRGVITSVKQSIKGEKAAGMFI